MKKIIKLTLFMIFLFPSVISAQQYYCDSPVCKAEGEYNAKYVWRDCFDITVPDGGNVLFHAHTENLTYLSYYPPDTIMWLIKLNYYYNGEVLEFDDDGYVDNDCGSSSPNFPQCNLDSEITLRLYSSGTYCIITSSYMNRNYGLMNIIIKINGELLPNYPKQGQNFGGYHIKRVLKEGDKVFVGALDSGYSDTILHVFTNYRANQPPGRYYSNDDYVQLLSYLELLSDAYYGPLGEIIVGTYSPSVSSNVRTFHSRLSSQWGSWNCDLNPPSSFADCDGDKLTWEIEKELNTCDKENGPGVNVPNPGQPPSQFVGIPGKGCSEYSYFINNYWAGKGKDCFTAKQDIECFNPKDSDNDGLKDMWEIFGVRIRCEKSPTNPYYDPGTCYDVEENYCATCKFGTSLALSTLEQPDPTIPDVFYHIDYQYGVGHPEHKLHSESITKVKYFYEQEGLECINIDSSQGLPPSACPYDPLYVVKLHPYNTNGITEDPHVGWYRKIAYSYYNNPSYFFSRRSYTKTFHYALGEHGATPPSAGGYGFIGGESESHPGAIFIWFGGVGLDWTPYIIYSSEVFAHEAAHTLGQPDGGCDLKKYKPNYPSLIDYGYLHSNAKKGNNFPPVCSSYGVSFGRFSRGGNSLLNEGYLQEKNIDIKLSREVYCGYPEFEVKNCSGNYCDIDWNGDGNIETLIDFDLNGDGSISYLYDCDDWEAFLNNIKMGLINNSPYRKKFWVYHSLLDGNSNDITGYKNNGSLYNVSFMDAPKWYNYQGKCAVFNGSNSYILLPSSPSIQSLGKITDGKNPIGFQIELYFRIFEPITTNEQYLIDNNLFKVSISKLSDKEGKLYAYVFDGSKWVSISYTYYPPPYNPISTGNWYWLMFNWDLNAGKAHLGVTVKDTNKDKWLDYCPEKILVYYITPVPNFNVDPGDVYIGKHKTISEGVLKGNIDYIIIANYPYKEGHCFKSAGFEQE